MLSHGQEADNFTWSVFPITREKYGETIGTGDGEEIGRA